MKRDANDILREEGEAALRAAFDAAAAKPYKSKANGRANGNTRSDRLIRSSADFVAGFIPPDYLVDGLLQRRFVYSFTGATGAGKTTITLRLAACVALGLPFGGREVETGRVVFLAGENPDDIRMRWIALSETMGFDLSSIDVHFIPGVFKVSEMEGRIRQEVEELGGVSLVIIDTSAAYYEGNDENQNVEMVTHARRFRSLTTLAGGPCVLVNCHPVKNAGLDNLLPRGGGGFLNEMDGNLTDVKNDMLSTVHWQGKFRGPDFAPMTFEMQTVTTERIKDSKGRPIPTVVAKPLTEDEEQAKAADIRSNEDAVLVVLLDSENEHLSMAAIAERLRWFTTKGVPYKSKVERAVKRLRSDKLVATERGNLLLTEKGAKAARKAKFNHETAGATYG